MNYELYIIDIRISIQYRGIKTAKGDFFGFIKVHALVRCTNKLKVGYTAQVKNQIVMKLNMKFQQQY